MQIHRNNGDRKRFNNMSSVDEILFQTELNQRFPEREFGNFLMPTNEYSPYPINPAIPDQTRKSETTRPSGQGPISVVA